LVAAATGQMMVYSHKRLVWAAKGDTCPVAVKVATFAGLQGTRSSGLTCQTVTSKSNLV